jgi:hypothetical protein
MQAKREREGQREREEKKEIKRERERERDGAAQVETSLPSAVHVCSFPAPANGRAAHFALRCQNLVRGGGACSAAGNLTRLMLDPCRLLPYSYSTEW